MPACVRSTSGSTHSSDFGETLDLLISRAGNVILFDQFRGGPDHSESGSIIIIDVFLSFCQLSNSSTASIAWLIGDHPEQLPPLPSNIQADRAQLRSYDKCRIFQTMPNTLPIPFQHEPLESPERQIRLLSVLPSPDGVQARYKLKTYILGGHKTPHFYAVSYEWGPEHPLHEIIIDDRIFLIRSNLKDCLERLGSAYEGFLRPVWIDAISIDQGNRRERNLQVQIMGDIYSSAKLVLAWFGKQAPSNGTLTKAVSCLRDWQASQEYGQIVKQGERAAGQAPRAQQRATAPALLSLAEPYGSVWSCLMNLSQQTYWTRLWIVQELVRAKELLLMWGDEQIPWKELAAAFHTIQLNTLFIRTSEARFAPWDAIALSAPFQIWLQRDGTRPKQSLLELMEAYRGSECSVPHDKAYALTGISTDSHLIQIDYHESLPDLYVNLMKLVPEKSQCIRYSHLILSALGLDSQSLLLGAGMTSLRQQSIECDAYRIGKVEATKVVGINVPPGNVRTEIFELLLMASALLSDIIIDRMSDWAQSIHRSLRAQLLAGCEGVTFFWLSNNQLGAGLSTLPVGHSVYRLPGLTDSERFVYVRVDDDRCVEADPGSPRTGIESPQLSSPSHSHSTFFSEPDNELASRVWVSNILLAEAAPSHNTESNSEKLMPIQIPLTDLVAMENVLGIDIEGAEANTEDYVPALRRERGQTRSDGPRRRGTRDSASISDVIDEAMRRPSTGLVKSSTWPTNTAGSTFIDALSRDLRDKLFASAASSLNLPD